MIVSKCRKLNISNLKDNSNRFANSTKQKRLIDAYSLPLPSVKNILMISPLWTGMAAFFFEGKMEFKGMPGFCKVFLKMLNDGHSVHLILFISKKRWGVKEVVLQKQFPNLTIYPIYFDLGFDLMRNAFKSYKMGKSLIQSNAFDLLYGQGSVGAVAGLLGRKYKLKSAQRIYGTFLINELHLSKWKIFSRHPLEYLAFSLPTNHVIITNDGTHGDQVFDYLGSNKSKLHFLINGVDKDKLVENVPSSERYITYVARVDTWKRQHLMLHALKELKDQGIEIAAKIVGPVYNEDYCEELRAYIKTHQLNKVEIVGGKKVDEVIEIQRGAYFTMSLYHTSNLGNVFLESLFMGIPIVAINCLNSLEEIQDDAYVKCDEESPAYLAQKMKRLIEDTSYRKEVSEKAKVFAASKLYDWEERVDKELNILLGK